MEGEVGKGELTQRAVPAKRHRRSEQLRWCAHRTAAPKSPVNPEQSRIRLTWLSLSYHRKPVHVLVVPGYRGSEQDGTLKCTLQHCLRVGEGGGTVGGIRAPAPLLKDIIACNWTDLCRDAHNNQSGRQRRFGGRLGANTTGVGIAHRSAHQTSNVWQKGAGQRQGGAGPRWGSHPQHVHQTVEQRTCIVHQESSACTVTLSCIECSGRCFGLSCQLSQRSLLCRIHPDLQQQQVDVVPHAAQWRHTHAWVSRDGFKFMTGPGGSTSAKIS